MHGVLHTPNFHACASLVPDSLLDKADQLLFLADL